MSRTKRWSNSKAVRAAQQPDPKPPPPLSRRLPFNRVLGWLLLGLGLYLAYLEKGEIARTGHGGRKSAAVPFIICASLALVVDPNFRRPGISATLYILGFFGGVVWFFLWV